MTNDSELLEGLELYIKNMLITPSYIYLYKMRDFVKFSDKYMCSKNCCVICHVCHCTRQNANFDFNKSLTLVFWSARIIFLLLHRRK